MKAIDLFGGLFVVLAGVFLSLCKYSNAFLIPSWNKEPSRTRTSDSVFSAGSCHLKQHVLPIQLLDNEISIRMIEKRDGSQKPDNFKITEQGKMGRKKFLLNGILAFFGPFLLPNLFQSDKAQAFAKFKPPPIDMASAGRCVMDNCGDLVSACFKEEECRNVYMCLAQCDLTDQSCTYDCITSYESELSKQLLECVLQQNNCLQRDAPLVAPPEKIQPMQSFRGKPLTNEVAEEIMIGWLSKEVPWSWRIVCGENPVYDCYRDQYQTFYRAPLGRSVAGYHEKYGNKYSSTSRGNGGGETMMWYDPLYKVGSVSSSSKGKGKDKGKGKGKGKEKSKGGGGDRAWRRVHYNVRPFNGTKYANRGVSSGSSGSSSRKITLGNEPGRFFMTALDNGVVSEEVWTVVDCGEDMSWALLHYSGAAPVAGMSYSGAFLVSPDGYWPGVNTKYAILDRSDSSGSTSTTSASSIGGESRERMSRESTSGSETGGSSSSSSSGTGGVITVGLGNSNLNANNEDANRNTIGGFVGGSTLGLVEAPRLAVGDYLERIEQITRINTNSASASAAASAAVEGNFGGGPTPTGPYGRLPGDLPNGLARGTGSGSTSSDGKIVVQVPCETAEEAVRSRARDTAIRAALKRSGIELRYELCQDRVCRAK